MGQGFLELRYNDLSHVLVGEYNVKNGHVILFKFGEPQASEILRYLLGCPENLCVIFCQKLQL